MRNDALGYSSDFIETEDSFLSVEEFREILG